VEKSSAKFCLTCVIFKYIFAKSKQLFYRRKFAQSGRPANCEGQPVFECLFNWQLQEGNLHLASLSRITETRGQRNAQESAAAIEILGAMAAAL
jgi:hypothetical protein